MEPSTFSFDDAIEVFEGYLKQITTKNPNPVLVNTAIAILNNLPCNWEAITFVQDTIKELEKVEKAIYTNDPQLQSKIESVREQWAKTRAAISPEIKKGQESLPQPKAFPQPKAVPVFSKMTFNILGELEWGEEELKERGVPQPIIVPTRPPTPTPQLRSSTQPQADTIKVIDGSFDKITTQSTPRHVKNTIVKLGLLEPHPAIMVTIDKLRAAETAMSSRSADLQEKIDDAKKQWEATKVLISSPVAKTKREPRPGPTLRPSEVQQDIEKQRQLKRGVTSDFSRKSFFTSKFDPLTTIIEGYEEDEEDEEDEKATQASQTTTTTVDKKQATVDKKQAMEELLFAFFGEKYAKHFLGKDLRGKVYVRSRRKAADLITQYSKANSRPQRPCRPCALSWDPTKNEHVFSTMNINMQIEHYVIDSFRDENGETTADPSKIKGIAIQGAKEIRVFNTWKEFLDTQTFTHYMREHR